MITVTSLPSWQAQSLGAAPCDRRHDLLPTDIDDHFGHDRPELHRSHRPLQLVARADLHPVPPSGSDPWRPQRTAPPQVGQDLHLHGLERCPGVDAVTQPEPFAPTPRVTSATSGGALAMRTRARSPSTAIDVTRPWTHVARRPVRELQRERDVGGPERGRSTSPPSNPSGQGTTMSPSPVDQAARRPPRAARGPRGTRSRRRGPRRSAIAAPRGSPRASRSATRGRPRASTSRSASVDRLDRVVRDDDPDAREALELVPDELADAHACADVERREWFVEQQQRRFDDEGAGERDPLRLAAREVARACARRGSRDPSRPSSSLARSARLRSRHAARPERERDVLESPTGAGTAAGPGTPRRSAVARAGRGRSLAGSSSTAPSSAIDPLDRWQQAGDRRDERRLPRAVRPEERDRLTGLGLERRPDRERPAAGGDVDRRASSRGTALGATRITREREEDQEHRDGERGVRVGLQLLEDRERERLGPSLQVPGERDRRPELAERPRPRQDERGRDLRTPSAGPSPAAGRTSARRRASTPRPPAARRGRAGPPRARAPRAGTRRTWPPAPPRPVVNVSWMPNHSYSHDPTSPLRRPNAASRPTPATTGGMTSGRTTIARTRVFPGNVLRARTHASGNPRTNEIAAAVVATTSESRSAVSAVSLVRTSAMRDQGVRSTRPSEGQRDEGDAERREDDEAGRDPPPTVGGGSRTRRASAVRRRGRSRRSPARGRPPRIRSRPRSDRSR